MAYAVGIELRWIASCGAGFYDPLEDVVLDDRKLQSKSENKQLTGFSCVGFRLAFRKSCIIGVQYLMPASVSRLAFHDINGAKIGLRTFGTNVMNKPWNGMSIANRRIVSRKASSLPEFLSVSSRSFDGEG